ncbi:MAG: hypothetical protein QW228_03155 [Candidatus Aenigmatarchaeota archaeon]
MPELLTEVHLVEFSVNEVSDKGKTRLVVRGPFGYVDKPTLNKRIYPRAIVEREINRLRGYIENAMLYGECEHPATGKTELHRISHRITKLAIVDDLVVGEAIVLDTPYGNIVKEILITGGRIGVSSRGFGSLSPTQDGYYVVQEDFNLITYDFVTQPAADVAIIKDYDLVKINEALESISIPVNDDAADKNDKKVMIVVDKIPGASEEDKDVKLILEHLSSMPKAEQVEVISDKIEKLQALFLEDFKEFKNEIVNLYSMNDDLAGGILKIFDNLHDLFVKTEKDKQVLVSENRKLRNRIEKLTKEISKVSTSLNKLDEYVAETSVLQENLENLRSENEILRQENLTLNQTVGDLKSILKDILDFLKDAEYDVSEIYEAFSNGDYDLVRRGVLNLLNEIAGLGIYEDEFVEGLLERFERERRSLFEKIEQLQKNISSLNKEIKSLKEEKRKAISESVQPKAGSRDRVAKARSKIIETLEEIEKNVPPGKQVKEVSYYDKELHSSSKNLYNQELPYDEKTIERMRILAGIQSPKTSDKGNK